MKNITLITGLFFLLLTAFQTPEKKYKVNTATSSVEWIAEKVTGSHNGNVQIKEGKIVVLNGTIVSGILVLDMNTIKVMDIESEKMNEKLKSHLYSSDFFGVKKHPTATLKINKVITNDGNNHIIYGDLTIKDITEKIEIPATILKEKNKIVAVGETKIDRTKFDIQYGSGSFFDNLGDKAINNEFTIKFKVGATEE